MRCEEWISITRTSRLLFGKLFGQLDGVKGQLDGLFSCVTEDNLAENGRDSVVKMYDSMSSSS